MNMHNTIIYDLPNMHDTFELFKHKFNALHDFGKMKKYERFGCKLGHKGGSLYLIPNNIGQPIIRWLYSESRDTLYNYIYKEFDNFISFLDMIT